MLERCRILYREVQRLAIEDHFKNSKVEMNLSSWHDNATTSLYVIGRVHEGDLVHTKRGSRFNVKQDMDDFPCFKMGP